jgi:hypothetical protein
VRWYKILFYLVFLGRARRSATFLGVIVGVVVVVVAGLKENSARSKIFLFSGKSAEQNCTKETNSQRQQQRQLVFFCQKTMLFTTTPTTMTMGQRSLLSIFAVFYASVYREIKI